MLPNGIFSSLFMLKELSVSIFDYKYSLPYPARYISDSPISALPEGLFNVTSVATIMSVYVHILSFGG